MTRILNNIMPLPVYAKANEGEGGSPATNEAPTEPTNEAPIEQAAIDPFAGFDIEVEPFGREQESPYGWEKFPAPAPKQDPETGTITGHKFAAKTFDLNGRKPDAVRGSLKKYIDRLKDKGVSPLPEFRTTVLKDGDKAIGVRVMRVK